MTSEITVKIDCDMQKCFDILKDRFELVLQWTQISSYWTHLSLNETIDYKTLLDNSILLRDMNGESIKETQLIYKQKTLDENGNVIAEEKINCDLDNAGKADEIFKMANFKNWVVMTAEQYIFKNEELEFCIQDVDGLGLYLEIEQRENMVGQSIEELIEVATCLGLPLGNDFVGIKLPYELYLKNEKPI